MPFAGLKVLSLESRRAKEMEVLIRREGGEVRTSLAQHTVLASVGPIMTTALERAGLKADIIPIHPKMAALVKASAEQAADALTRKRAAP
jgi:uroporphyrinogen-III synthase